MCATLTSRRVVMNIVQSRDTWTLKEYPGLTYCLNILSVYFTCLSKIKILLFHCVVMSVHEKHLRLHIDSTPVA